MFMKSIFFCIICIYTFFLPFISFASTSKAISHFHQIHLSQSLSTNGYSEIVEIEEDDLQAFEFKNCWFKQNNKNNVFLNSQKDLDQSLKTVLCHNNLFYPIYPLFILHQVFSI